MKTAEKIYDLVHKSSERSTKPASEFDKYSSVEFSISNLHYIYQFKIQENSLRHGCLYKRGFCRLKTLKNR